MHLCSGQGTLYLFHYYAVLPERHVIKAVGHSLDGMLVGQWVISKL